MGNNQNLIEKIQKMYEEGKLDTNQSVDLILQISFELYKGQQEMLISLADRQTSIDDLKNNLEQTDSAVEKINEELDEIKKIVNMIEQNSFTLWMQKHPMLSKAIFIAIILFINFHEVLSTYILAFFGYKAP